MLKGLISTVFVTLAAAEGKDDACLQDCLVRFMQTGDQKAYDKCFAACNSIPTPQKNEPTCEQQCIITYAFDQDDAKYMDCLEACNPPPPFDCTTCSPCGKERD